MFARVILVVGILLLTACGSTKEATFTVEPVPSGETGSLDESDPAAPTVEVAASIEPDDLPDETASEAPDGEITPADPVGPEPEPDPIVAITVNSIIDELGLHRFDLYDPTLEEMHVFFGGDRIFKTNEVDLSFSDDEDFAEALQNGSVDASELGIEPMALLVPDVVPVTLPDLTDVTEVGEVIRADLGSFSGTGIDVAGASCVADGDELSYRNDDEGFLSKGIGGTDRYVSDDLSNPVEIVRNEDGSGTYYRYDSRAGISIDVDVAADGSGSYRWADNPNVLEVDVASDGTGRFQRNFTEGVTTIDLLADGTGVWQFFQPASGGRTGLIVDIVARPDGTGLVKSFIETEFRRNFHRLADGGWALANGRSSDAGQFELVVNPDGSGLIFDNDRDLLILVTADGQGFARQGGLPEPWFAFTTNTGITDPALVTFGPLPEFTVAAAFPPLDTLPPIQAPCATVLRIPDTVLFDFDSAELRAEADSVLDEIATTLNDALENQSLDLEVLGHTDALGDNSYNLDLSQRRASAVRGALVDRGVSTAISSRGLGEAAPVAPNENADGSDNPAGRQQNRRVEIVIRGEA